MDQVPDISQFSEEEQRILRDVMSRAQDEDEKDRKDFRKEEKALSILESAVILRQREKVDVDLNTTCNICFKTKFADGVGHICETCRVRCCARCGVKVIRTNKKLWLCILCRKKKELAYKFSKYLKGDNAKSWGRSRSLEEEASSKRLATTPLSAMTRRFPSALNITAPSLPFWSGEKKQQQQQLQQQQQQQSTVRPDPLPPRRDILPYSPGGGGDRRYSRRRSSLDTLRNDSLSSDQSENPPPRPKPSGKKGNNGHRYRRSGSSGSEDEARSSPSSCHDSESDRVSLRKEKRPVRENRWLRSQEDSQLTTSVSDFMEVSKLIATSKELHASSLKATTATTSCNKARYSETYQLPSNFKRSMKPFATDRRFSVVFDRSLDAESEDQFDIFGKHIAAKLRTMPKRQRIIAEKLISDTLFEAELGTLNRNSKINVL